MLEALAETHSRAQEAAALEASPSHQQVACLAAHDRFISRQAVVETASTSQMPTISLANSCAIAAAAAAAMTLTSAASVWAVCLAEWVACPAAVEVEKAAGSEADDEHQSLKSQS
jgi:hypothetical protein